MTEHGVKRVVADAMAAVAPEAPELPLALPLARRVAEAPRQGPGRPRGSIGRISALVRDRFLARYADPMEGLAEIYSRPTAELAQEIGCTRLEAFDLQRKAMVDLMPYLFHRMPLALQTEGKAAPMLMIVDPRTMAREAAPDEAADMTIDLRIDPPANVDESKA
jgi:hypothetical protein